MKRRIKVGGVDPSLTHTGIAKGYFDLDTREWHLEYVLMAITENESGKTVRKNSDDLRRSRIATRAIYDNLSDCDVIFSEIPSGAQSARAATAFGIVIGMLGGILESPDFRPAFIQLMPTEVKLSIPGGSKVTSKEEIVEWASAKWPNAGWKKGGAKAKFVFGDVRLTADNEHMADACAVIQAGVRTDEFRNLLAAFERAIPKGQE
jgi:hypothetical protein